MVTLESSTVPGGSPAGLNPSCPQCQPTDQHTFFSFPFFPVSPPHSLHASWDHLPSKLQLLKSSAQGLPLGKPHPGQTPSPKMTPLAQGNNIQESCQKSQPPSLQAWVTAHFNELHILQLLWAVISLRASVTLPWTLAG